MDLRFYIDAETGEPHIYRHSVSETEVDDVLARPVEDGRGTGNARVAIGQTGDGRYLRVIYARDPGRDTLFVITAYQLGPKALSALRRRQRRRH